jgi:4-carboxymuconolactone decarboxylase
MTSQGELRLPVVPVAEWGDETRTVLLQHLRRPEIYLSGGPDAPPMPVVLEMFAQHVPLGDSWMNFTDMLAGSDSRLAPSERELLILRVAWLTRSGYEWVQHARMGVDAGLTSEQVHAIPHWQASPLWSPKERALLGAVDEVLAHAAVGEETWKELGTTFDPAQLLEILFVIGGYQCLAAVLNTVGLQSDLPSDQAGTAAP